MSLWRGILQQRRDEWTSSLRGLDGLEAKPEIYNDNIPAFRHNGAKLVVRRELRSDEAFLKDFTPFVNKKPEEFLKKRRTEWFGSNTGDLNGLFASFFNQAQREYQAQDEPIEGFASDLFGVSDTESEEEDDGIPRLEGESEDERFFEEHGTMERLDNPHAPGSAEYKMVEEHNKIVDRYEGSLPRAVYKERQMERLSIALQRAEKGSREEKKAYGEFLSATLRGGGTERSFVETWGEKPGSVPSAPSAAVGGGAGGGGGGGVSEDTRAWLDARNEKGYPYTANQLKEFIREAKGTFVSPSGKRAQSASALIELLVIRGIKPPKSRK